MIAQVVHGVVMLACLGVVTRAVLRYRREGRLCAQDTPPS